MRTRSAKKMLPSEMAATEEPPSKKTKYSKLRNKIPDEEMDVDIDPDLTLPVAIKNDDIKAIDYLLNKKIDVDINQESSPPALHLAVETKNLEIINKLVDHKADIGIIYENKTALHLAVEQGNKAMIEILLKTKKNKSKVNARAKGHPTPLNVAIKSGNFEIFQLLINSGAYIKQIIRGDNPLHYTAQNNAVEIAEYLISQGAKVDTDMKNKLSPFHHCTPLHVAINCGSFEVAQLLINKQASVHAKTTWGKKPLDLAIEKGNYRIFKLLVDSGATVDLSYKNMNRLHWAAYHNSLEIAQYLFSIGDDIHFNCFYRWSDFYQYTPLHVAIQQGSVKVAQFLLSKGADVNICGKNGESPLTIAIEKKNFKLFQLLLDTGAEINDCPNKILPLHQAVAVSNVDVTKFFLERGVDVNVICKCLVSKYSDCTPLQLAVSTENLEIINLLLKHKADVNISTEKLGSPTGIAVDRNNYELYELLLKAGADINKPSNMTLLHRAVGANNYRIANDLIKLGADVNAINRSGTSKYSGCSPLQISIMNENKKIATLLLEKQAKVDDEKFVKTPLGIACEWGNFELVKILVNAGADINKISNHAMPLYWAVDKPNYQIVKYLIDRNAHVNIIYNGTTLLYRAVESESIKIVEFLLKNGAEVNAINDYGETSLTVAVNKDNLELVKILINAGAQVNLSNDKNYSPLHWAVQRSNYSTTQYLIEQGAEINSIRFGTTPLTIACDNGRKDIVELLIKSGAIIDDKRVYRTALGIACEQANFDLVELLVNFGASVDLLSGNGTPLCWAVNSKNFNIVKYLIDHGVEDIDARWHGTTPLYLAIVNQDLKIVKLLLEHRATVNKVNKNGTTALGLAIKTSNLELFELILHAEGTDINAPCHDNRRPLEIVAQNHDVALMKLLINHRANFDFITKENLKFIFHVLHVGNIEMLMLILSENVDINCRDLNNETLLFSAIRQRSFEKTELILMSEDFVNINDVPQSESALHEAGKFGDANAFVLNLLLNAGADVNLVNRGNQTAINTTNFERNKKIIREHIVKLKAAGWSLINQNLKAIIGKGLDDFYIDCLKEIELMKNFKIDQTIMSYYDVLRINHHEIAVKSNNFNEGSLNEKELQLQFPLYGQIIYYRLFKSLQRNKLLDMSTNVFGTLFSGQLPFDVIRAINPYLNNRDLKMLSQC
ncbi:ankyrin-3-like [Microplitis mediator]|uniref:ankyrin-3-like n=1 Tax=Microplitis mediator TaxID=375433 RepID=UPI0025560DB0|nr:ankyrin-3-like [Microplitis mediator]